MAWPSNAHLNVHAFVGYCRHDYIIPPAVPTVWNFIDFDVVNGITGLFAWPTAEFAFPPARKPGRGQVLDVGLPMEGRDTDASFVVPHVPVPLVPSVLLPLIIVFGSSKIIMGSNKTRIWCKGLSGLTGEVEQAVGCCVIPYLPMSVNLQCWDFKCKKYDVSIGAPMMTDVVIAPNSVQVGIELSDYLAAMVDWAVDVVLAVLVAGATKAIKGGPSKELDEQAKKSLWKRAKKMLSNAWKCIGKKAGRQEWVIGLAVKLPYRMLVKNTEWYRDDVQRPIESKL
jgi:hypothetical protein